jgi:ribosomal protein L11 methyltransferase
MSDTWVELSCRVPKDLVDQLADFLVDLSGSGVCIDNQMLDTFSLETLDESPILTVKAYFTAGPELERNLAEVTAYMAELCAAVPEFSPLPPVVAVVKQEDWATSWKQYFHTGTIGRRLVLKPSWEEFDPKGDQVIIEIDPGMAFGTGTHPTTRLCLEALERIVDAAPPFTGMSLPEAFNVLDVGTGSGVLAIAARKLGGGHMVALDIDPQAVEVARQNLANNGITEALDVGITPVSEITAEFSVVFANILAEDLIKMSPLLSPRLLPGGVLILSGILTEKEGGVTAAYAATGLTLVEATRLDEWSCLVYRRGE